MADRFAATGANAVTATPGDTVLTVKASTSVRGRIYDLVFGTTGTPADNAIEWLVRRFTATGTGTAVTPAKLDTSSPAAQLSADENHTAEPTYTAATELLDMGLNQRGTFRWIASPGGEIVVPASANNGVGITPIHASYTGSAEATAHWEE